MVGEVPGLNKELAELDIGRHGEAARLQARAELVELLQRHVDEANLPTDSDFPVFGISPDCQMDNSGTGGCSGILGNESAPTKVCFPLLGKSQLHRKTRDRPW